MVCVQGLSEPGTLPQHSQPLPQTPSQHYSCHTIKEQLVEGRSDLPYCEVHVSPICDSVCLHMERKYWNFCFDVSSSDPSYKCCSVFNTRLTPVKNPFGSSAPQEPHTKPWTVLLSDIYVYFSTEEGKTFTEKFPAWKSKSLHSILYTPVLVS